jgi:16S rRNA (uracil1498-N3)-methyltransferase
VSLRSPYFVAETDVLRGDRIVLRGPEGRHATTVRRLAVGETAYVTDGVGSVAECRVTAARPGELELRVLDLHAEPRPVPALAVAQAIPKGDRAEQAVELLTEVGVDVIVPWAAQRCVVQWRGDRAARSLARWQSAALQAAKQSRRAWFPEITAQAGLESLAERVKSAALAILLDADAPGRLSDLSVPEDGEVVLIVGPEGGMTGAEQAALQDAGAVAARLGPTMLRASSAGITAAGIVLSRSTRW